ncbi:MAG: DUF3883 domain-containing protein [Gammaproteobacteria bacterium]|nr:DUF3883 domain-containing protein [Gammaproteobacteria bacterium]
MFTFDGGALLVANTGAKFTRKGVVSICNMDLSAKTADSTSEPDDREYDKSDRKLVCSILEKRIKEYKGDINRLKEDVNREKGVRKSYTGRFVWELLQNADDAMDTNRSNANLIGAKGIGFKSVLEITDEPEIYSGDFCFHFSREKSQGKLGENKKWNEEMGIPVCRLPHPQKPEPTAKKLHDEGHVTVLRLPLNKEKRETVEDKLAGFCRHSLLFCQHIESVDMRTDAASRYIKVHRDDEGRVKLVENDRSTHWRVWDEKKDIEGQKRLSIRMCLPIEDGKISCLEEVPWLYVFFPTAEQIPDVYALIHVSCEVDDNRQHLASDQPHSDKICEMLAGMTKKILSEIPPDVALRAFGHVQVAEDAGNRMAMQLGKAIATTVQETAFIPLIGGGMAKPGDVRLWKHGLGNAIDPSKAKNQNLCHPDINDDKKSAEILSRLGAKRASRPELARLLRFCRNSDGKDCLMAWNVAQTLMSEIKPEEKEEKAECAEELRKAPFWLSGNGEVKARSIDGAIPLVATKPKNLPHWLPVDVIDKRFRELVQDEIKRHKEGGESWENTLSGSLQPPENKQGYFDQILLPYCEKLTPEEWQKNGWKVLEMAFKWGEKDGSGEPFIIDSSDIGKQQERAEIFHLPVGEGAQKWVPALQCYAGAAWNGPKIFDKYFSEVENRYVLSPADDWEISAANANKDQWNKLLSWLGCSWILKIKMESGLYPKRDDVNHTRGRSFSDFCFEHFDEMFATPNNEKVLDYVPLLNMVPEMYKIACKEKARYFHYSDTFVESYALQQLKIKEWVPCKQSLFYPNKRLFKPEAIYLPDCGLDGFLPEVRKSDLDCAKWANIQETLKKLGANDSISKDPEQLTQYMDKLSKLSGKNGKGRDTIARAAKAIFSAYGEIEPPPELRDGVMVPCLRHTREGEMIYFKKADSACWADKSYFGEAEVRREILKADKLHVFFRFLQDGESFGLKKLSDFLQMQPRHTHEHEQPQLSEKLHQKYQERRVGMAKATNQKLSKKLKITAYRSIPLKATKHAEITIQAIKFWKQNEHKVDINAGADMWQGLAAALGELTNGSQYKPDFELLLKEETRESFLDRLRDDYGLTEESIEEVEESIENNNAGEAEETQEEYSDDSTSTGNQTQTATTKTTSSKKNVGGNHQQPEVPKIEVESNPDWSTEIITPPGSGVGNDVDVHAVKGSDGKRGEEALLNWLKSVFKDSDVINKNEQCRNHPGYDILVTKKNGKEYYYECKSFVSATPPCQVSLTKAQFDKAKCTRHRYRLCVIYNLKENPVKMLEICDPAALENKPITTEYKIDLTSWKSDTE